MKYEDSLAHAYERLSELEDDKKIIRQKVLFEEGYTETQYKKDLDLYKAKKAYLEERLKVLLNINAILRNIRKHPKKAKKYKAVEDPKQWKIFSDNLKEYQWIPFEGECCSFCGRTQTSTTSIAAALLTTGELDIICSRCFEKQLKNSTVNTTGDDTNATR